MNVIAGVFRYESCKLWIESLRTDSTKRAYAYHLLLFCSFYQTNPDKLAKLSSDKLKEMVINYILELKKKCKNSAGKPKLGEMSVNSIKSYLTGVQSFFEEHEKSLPWKKISRYYPADVTNDYRAYTKPEISKLLSMADLRDRCIILLLASSGIRVGAIPTLTIKSLKRLDHGLGQLTVYGESLKSRYVTLVTPECMSTIDEYLEQRRKQGEILNESSCLIRDKYSIFSKRINRPRAPTKITINISMRKLIRKAGLPFEELQPDHGFRKFFNTVLFNSKVDGKFKELMMGHSIKLDEFYYDKNDEESRKQIILEYMKAVDALTINDEYRLRKQISEFEEKLKRVPKVEQLQEQLASRIIEEDSIKRQLELARTSHEQNMKTMQDQMNQKVNELESQMSQFFEVLQFAKLKNGMIRKDLSIVDQERNVTAKYVDDRNQIRTVKFPIDAVEIS
jgi:integrase